MKADAGGRADREDEVVFTCDERTIKARAGQSVAAALWAHGDRVLARSTKFHRPRGWSCGTGDCANCVMRVDGLPNVRTCMVEARPGMQVEGQNAWPSVRHDMFRVNDLVFRKGIDHHRSFVRPRFLYALFARVIRAFAGWGRIPERPAREPKAGTRRVDVVVSGGGPAGLAAATAAGQAGAQVLLVDRHAQPGGVVAWMKRELADPDADPPGRRSLPGSELAARWVEEARATGRVVLQPGSVVAGVYPGLVHLVRGPDSIDLVTSGACVMTTGAMMNEGLFDGNDLPGVMGAVGCLALLNREGVSPGRRAVVLGAGAHGLAVALELDRAGVDVRGVVEPASRVPGPRALLEEVRNRGIRVDAGTRVLRARGWNRLRAVTLEGASGRRRVKADLLVVALGAKTLPFAVQGLGARLMHDAGRGGTVPVVDDDMMTSVDGVFVAGDQAGVGTIASARASGRLAGLAAAARLGFEHADLEGERLRLRRVLGESVVRSAVSSKPGDGGPGGAREAGGLEEVLR